MIDMKKRNFKFLLKLKKIKFELIVILIATIFIQLSCDDESLNPYQFEFPQTLNFANSEFVNGIECYDSLGNNLDYISPNYIRNDFLFRDGGIYPYEKIEINRDSSVSFYYTSMEITHSDDGYVASVKDTLYFYSTEINNEGLLFKAVYYYDRLIIPAYGVKIEWTSSYGFGYYSSTDFGNPDFPALLNRVEYYGGEKIYIQKFNLIYEKEFN